MKFKNILLKESIELSHVSSYVWDAACVAVMLSGRYEELYPEKRRVNIALQSGNRYWMGSKKEYEEYRDEVFQMFAEMPDPIPVWRVVSVNSKKEINLQDAGISWSWDLDAIKNNTAQIDMDFNKKFMVTLSGEASKSEIDWYNTIACYLAFSMSEEDGGDAGEDEIVCHSVQNIKVEKIEKMV